MEWNYKFVHGHIEVYNNEGEFCFSADTMQEVMLETMQQAA